MNKVLVAGCVLAGLMVTMADAAQPSLCTWLADKARCAPARTGAQDDPLAPSFKLDSEVLA